MDAIAINGLEFWARHGVLESERAQGQRFCADLRFTLDASACADEIANTVHYGELAEALVAFSQENTFRLLETWGNALARHLLRQFPKIEEITLCLHKPQAPIPLSFSDVKLTLTRRREVCYLGIGSNLGARAAHLDAVVRAIEADENLELCAVSSYHETAPYGVLDQPFFLNAAIALRSIYTPFELLQFCQGLEQASGRVRTRHWGERTLDVDLLFFGSHCQDTEELTLPHPELHKRSFVLEPLCEIAPRLRHPHYGKTAEELLLALRAQEGGKHGS